MNAILSEISALLAANGIIPTKELVISAAFKALVAQGVDAKSAFDAILGCGTFDQMAGDLHASFNV